MARISTYPLDSVPALGDKLLGTNAGDLATVNFTLTQVKALLRDYTSYAAILFQATTNAPVATVLENSLGGTIAWTRNSPGNYTATITGGTFATNKTLVFINQGGSSSTANIQWGSSTTAITIITGADDVLAKAAIEIRVYK